MLELNQLTALSKRGNREAVVSDCSLEKLFQITRKFHRWLRRYVSLKDSLKNVVNPIQDTLFKIS